MVSVEFDRPRGVGDGKVITTETGVRECPGVVALDEIRLELDRPVGIDQGDIVVATKVVCDRRAGYGQAVSGTDSRWPYQSRR